MVVAPTHEGSRRPLIADMSVVLSFVGSSDVMDAALLVFRWAESRHQASREALKIELKSIYPE